MILTVRSVLSATAPLIRNVSYAISERHNQTRSVTCLSLRAADVWTRSADANSMYVEVE